MGRWWLYRVWGFVIVLAILAGTGSTAIAQAKKSATRKVKSSTPSLSSQIAEQKRQIVEANSGGLAWFDYDGDGDPDLYLVNAGRRLRSTPPPADEATSGALFRNDGGRFTEVTRSAGLVDWRWGVGAAGRD